MASDFLEKKEYPPKVIAMNEAVMAFLAEGREPNSLRVSEITERAGIGKGTAYEYFSSKSEIITTALEYDFVKHISRLAELEEEAVGFREILEVLMQWVTESFRNNSVFTYAFRGDAKMREISKEIEPEMCPFKAGIDVLKKMIEQALEIGEQEKVIKKTDHYFGSVAIISQVISFSMYLGNPQYTSVSVEEAKEFAVNSIIKMLN